MKFYVKICVKLLFLKRNSKTQKERITYIVVVIVDLSTYCAFCVLKKEVEKNSKKFKKLLKKVLTNENIYDILHERSTEERKNNGP